MRTVHSASEEPEDDPLDVLASRIEAGEIHRDPTAEENDAFVDAILDALFSRHESANLRPVAERAWQKMCVAQAERMLASDKGESDE